MLQLAKEFYWSLYVSDGSTNSEKIQDLMGRPVTEEMNRALVVAWTDQEITEALFQMGPTKSPGLDGLPALFYQRHWPMLQGVICNAFRDFLSGKECPEDFNDTIVVLIPKVNSPELLTLSPHKPM
jgi:hypothetical protein